MASFELLDQAQEDALHKTRLLMNEEKPFRRISKRLLNGDSVIAASLKQRTNPNPVVEEDREALKQKNAEARRQFREEILLDSAAFESNIVRMQLLLTANQQERARYAEEKLRIQATAQEVRDNTVALRSQLEEAKQELAVRKTWDDLSEKITSNKLLKPREEQHSNIEKLRNEISELEKESQDYAAIWQERSQLFGRIFDEAMNLRRAIRDEKEEVERREGMADKEDTGDDGASHGGPSMIGTPRPQDGGATPAHNSGYGESGSLQPGGLSRNRSKSPMTGTPIPEEKPADEEEDLNMAEDGEVSGGDDGEIDDDSNREGVENMDVS